MRKGNTLRKERRAQAECPSVSPKEGPQEEDSHCAIRLRITPSHVDKTEESIRTWYPKQNTALREKMYP